MAAAQYRIVPMNALRMMTLRDVAHGIAASAAPFVIPRPSSAQSVARIVVIGGGFGGASCARAFRKIDPKLEVTLIEPNQTFTACPFSNEVIAGLRELEAQQFGYDRIIADGVGPRAPATTSPSLRSSACLAPWKPSTSTSPISCKKLRKFCFVQCR